MAKCIINVFILQNFQLVQLYSGSYLRLFCTEKKIKIYLEMGQKKRNWSQEDCIVSWAHALQYSKSLLYCDVIFLKVGFYKSDLEQFHYLDLCEKEIIFKL